MLRLSILPVFAVALLPAVAQAQTQQKPGSDFPEGPGKSTVVAVCNGCHDINRLRAGYSPAGWNTIQHMMENFGAPVPPEDWPTVVTYLMKHFPEKPRPVAAMVTGPVQVDIKTWPVPTLGSRPHDPLATKDGAIWWSGQLANKLGRLDPKTGAVREYALKSATGPHGLKEDQQGNIWFTGNFAGLIGKLDPKTGQVTEYKIPDPAAKDPHTLAIDPTTGLVWFTVQQANLLGRLDPKTGDIKTVKSPTERSRPYGLLVNSKSIPVFVEFGTNKIATMDPDTMAIKEYTLPQAASRPRRFALEGDNIVWYADFSRGYLGRFDLESGAHKEWQSPSGPKSEPYGMVFTKGAVWYNESGAKPNTIVRFDSQTEKFQTWIIPGGGDIVRNMDVMPDGNPAMAHSLANEVGVVQIR